MDGTNLFPVATLILALIRPMTAFAVLPPFTSKAMPASVRNTIAVTLCLPAVYTLLQRPPQVEPDLAVLIGIAMKEAMIGLCIGYLVSGLFWAAENVGHVIDLQTGLTMSGMGDPFSGNQSSVTSPLLLQIFIALFVAAGGLMVLLELIYTSYAIWPVGITSPNLSRATADFFIARTSDLMFITLLMAAPVVLVLNVMEVALGLLSRAAPMLQISQVISPIKGWLAGLILMLALTGVAQRLSELVGDFRPLFSRLTQVL